MVPPAWIVADDGEDLLDEHRGQPQRRLVEEHAGRGSAISAAADRQHLLLAAAQRPRQLRAPLGQDREMHA